MGRRDDRPEKRGRGTRRVVKAKLDKNENRERTDRPTKGDKDRVREQSDLGRDDRGPDRNRQSREPRSESQGSSFPWVAVIIVLIVIAAAVYFLFLR